MGIEAYGDVAEGALTEKAGHVQHFVGKALFLNSFLTHRRPMPAWG